MTGNIVVKYIAILYYEEDSIASSFKENAVVHKLGHLFKGSVHIMNDQLYT